MLGELLALVVAVVSLAVLIGHAYGAERLYRFGQYTAVAVHTAAALLVLALGVLAARPRRGLMALVAAPTLGGLAVRRQLPVVVVVLVAFGWLRIAGQEAGLYGTALGTALLVTASVVVFGVLIGATGRTLHRLDLRRRDAEAVVAGQRELLQATVTSIGDGVIATDAGGRVTLVNPVAETLTGWTQAEAAGQPLEVVFRIVNETTREPVENPALRALKEGVIVGLANHTVLIARNGTERPIDDSAAPIRAGGAAVAGAVLVFRDITERKREEVAQAERTRLVALRADVATTLASVQTIPTALHQCCEALVRHLDVAFARIWTLDDADAVLELRASAGLYTHLDGPHSRVPLGQFKIGRIAGTRQPHLTNCVPDDPNVSDREWAAREGMVAFAGYPLAVEGRVVGVVAMFARRPLSEGVLADLAPLAEGVAQYIDRKRGEDRSRRQAELHRVTLASIGDAVLTTDAAGAVAYLNAVAQEMTGWTQDDARGRPLASVFHIVNESTRQPVENPVQKVLALGQVMVDPENWTTG